MEDKQDKTKRLSVYLPEKVKSDLDHMADDTGLSMTQLIVMATQGLLANYAAQGGAIFADLLSARHRILHEVKEKQVLLDEEKKSMQAYYGARAEEYERIYHREDADFQQELALLSAIITEAGGGTPRTGNRLWHGLLDTNCCRNRIATGRGRHTPRGAAHCGVETMAERECLLYRRGCVRALRDTRGV